MKRVLSLFVALLSVMVLLCNPVFAASSTYDLDELELQVTIPSGYSVITRDTPANDPIFSDLGTTRSAILEQFKSGNIYLNAISETYNEEVVVTMMENSISNFSLLSDTALETLASALVDQYVNYGIKVSKYEIYHHSQAKFVRLYFTDTGKTVHGLQYYTIYDGKAMNFTMRSYEGSLSSRQENAIKTIVDSIKYDNAPPVVEEGEDTDAFTYKDNESGVSFTVPANWKQEAFTKDREFIDVKFASTKESGCVMIYGSTDMWAQMSASDRAGYKRSDINNSVFTKADIAAMYNTTADKITTVTYNGVQYFKGEPKYTSDAYGIDLSVTMTQLVYIENGWMYTFQFGGPSTHKLYSDFESLMKSVKYTSASSNTGISSGNQNNSKNNGDAEDNSSVIAVVVLLAVAVVIVVVIVVSRKKKSEEYYTPTYTPTYTPPVPQPPKPVEPTSICKNCGQALPLDSAFCHVCGTRIEKEN